MPAGNYNVITEDQPFASTGWIRCISGHENHTQWLIIMWPERNNYIKPLPTGGHKMFHVKSSLDLNLVTRQPLIEISFG